MITQISASAGSGKTYSLTRLFLDLLAGAEDQEYAAGRDRSNPAGAAPDRVLYEQGSARGLSEILAATFTNKAAAEMKSRVIEGLKEQALAERAAAGLRGPGGAKAEWDVRPGAVPAQTRLEYILRHYGALNILTIDSLLTSITRLSCLELGLPPDFVPSFSPEEFFTPVYDALMDDLSADGGLMPPASQQERSRPEDATPAAPGEVYRHGFADAFAEGPAMACGSSRVLYTADADRLRADLLKACRSLLFFDDCKGFSPRRLLHDRVYDLLCILLTGGALPRMDEASIIARLRAGRDRLIETASQLWKLLEAEQLRANAHFLKLLTACAGLRGHSPAPQSAYARKGSLDECLNATAKGTASEAAEEAFAKFSAALKAYAGTLPLFKQALQLAPLVTLTLEIHSRMQADRFSGKLLPALRIPCLAGRALSGEYGVSDALCRLGTGLRHLLLDEFQDTSREQWAAILPLVEESLSTGGSLTCVGDIKQAIYGWRGGDARLFEQVMNEASLLRMKPRLERRVLPFNWRSHPDIVAHNNAFFSLLDERGICEAALGAMLPDHTPESYRRQAADEAGRIFAGARQGIAPGKNWEEDPLSRHAGAALYLVEADTVGGVRDMVKTRLRSLFLNELLPVWRYGDIAVLTHSGDEGELVSAWLTDWGLPVVTDNSFLLASHPLLEKVISFLHFLDYPPDDAAFWETISDPDILWPQSNVTGADLLDWLSRVTLAYKSTAVPVLEGAPADMFHGPAAASPGGSAPRPAASAVAIARRPPLYRLFSEAFPEFWKERIAPFFSGAGLMSAYDILSETIRRCSLYERMPEQASFLLRLLEVAHMAETRGHSSLTGFLSFWRACREDERLPLPEGMDAVRVMTIHKAKGLEFPVVLLPFQHQGKGRESELRALRCDGLDLLARAGKEQPDLYYPAKIADELERLHLLYVAWTRPVYALHAFITRPKSSSSPLQRALNVLVSAHALRCPLGLCRWEELTSGSCHDAEQTEDASAQGDAAALSHCRKGQGPECGRPSFPAAQPREDSGYSGRHQAYTAPRAAALMSWLPRLKIHRSLESYRETTRCGPDALPAALPVPQDERKQRTADAAHNGLTPTQRGSVIHLCLEQLILPLSPHTEEAGVIIKTSVRRAASLGMRLFPLPPNFSADQTEELLDDIERRLLWFAGLPEAPMWLTYGLREQSILDEKGNMHRVDLLVDEALFTMPDEASRRMPDDEAPGGEASSGGAHSASCEEALFHMPDEASWQNASCNPPSGGHALPSGEEGEFFARGVYSYGIRPERKTMPDEASRQSTAAALRILDYKTGTPFTEAVKEEHRSQVRRYMRLLTQASGRSVVGTIVYLDEQRLEHISV